MREFEFIFDRGLTRGVRSNAQESITMQTLYNAYNVKAGKHGIEPYVPVSVPSYWSTVDNVWPYPIVCSGIRGSHLLTRQTSDSKIRLYKINSNNTLTLKHTFSAGSATATVIDYADFGECVMFVTDAYSLVHMSSAMTYTPDWDIEYPIMMPTELCCNFRNQLIYAKPKNAASYWPAPNNNLDKYVCWSDIGSLNIRMTNRVEAGGLFIPTSGSIVAIRPLENNIIVYCSDGIWALTPYQSPIFTYGHKKLYDCGISWKHGVAGNLNAHVAVLSTGELLLVDSALKVINLDFSERFDAPGATTVVFDERNNEWRISDTDTGWILTTKGLTSCYQRVTGILRNTSYAAAISSTDLTAYIETDTLNFGMNGVKTITAVEVGGQLPSIGGSVSIGYKYDAKSSVFTQSPAAVINPLGWTAAPVSGCDLRVRVTTNTYAGFYPKHLKVRWKMSDLRGLRGVYSPPPRGQYVD